MNIPSKLLVVGKIPLIMEIIEGLRSSDVKVRVIILAILSRCIASCT